MDHIAKQLKYTNIENWYTAKMSQLEEKAPQIHSILFYYEGSLIKALASIYPEVKWDPIRFAKVPHGKK